MSEQYQNDHYQNDSKSYSRLYSLTAAMFDYGAWAQQKFEINTDLPANEDLRNENGTAYATPQINSADIGTDHTVDMEDGLAEYGLAYEGTSLLYLNKTTLRHYYSITDTNKTARAVIEEVTSDAANTGWTGNTKGDYICFDKSGIGAHELGTACTLTINSKAYQYSALDYSKGVLEICEQPDGGFTDTGANLARATYAYATAAKAYQNQNGGE